MVEKHGEGYYGKKKLKLGVSVLGQIACMYLDNEQNDSWAYPLLLRKKKNNKFLVIKVDKVLGYLIQRVNIIKTLFNL